MVEILSLSKKAFGLEITDVAVRLMKLARRGGKLVVSAASWVPLEAGIVKDGNVMDEDRLAGAIREAIANSAGQSFKIRRVVVSLPENKSFLQVIKMPELRDQDLRAAVVYEAENHIPLPLEKVYLDFEVVEPSGKDLTGFGCEVLIAALPREPIDARIRAIVKAGLIPVAMELESQALVRALFAGHGSKPLVVIIQIGDEKTNLIVYSGNSIRFTFSIPISNRYFLETISRNAKVSIEEAEILKTKCGIEEFIHSDAKESKDHDYSAFLENSNDRRKIFEALIPGLVDFIQQVKKYVQYYQTHDNNSYPASDGAPGKIFICGSGSDLKGIDEFIALKLNASVERIHPSIDTNLFEPKPGNVLTRQNFCGFSVVAGLAMRGLDGGNGAEKRADLKRAPVPSRKGLRTRVKAG